MSWIKLPDGQDWCVSCQESPAFCGCTEPSDPPDFVWRCRIISGGQTGADQGGLWAGAMLGFPTGGVAPNRWQTETGPAPWLEAFGLTTLDRAVAASGELYYPKATDPAGYALRTRKNVLAASGTVLFGDVAERGTGLTLDLCKRLGKPYLVIPNPLAGGEWDSSILVLLRRFFDDLDFWQADNDSVLNVAGNRESKMPGLMAATTRLLRDAFFTEVPF